MIKWLRKLLGGPSEPGEWAVSTGNENGQPVIVRTRTRAPQGMRTDRFPAAVEIVWRFADAGMPSPEVAALLGECEDTLGVLEGPTNGLLGIIITGNGRREWVWYVADVAHFCARARDLLAASGTRFPVEVRPSPVTTAASMHEGSFTRVSSAPVPTARPGTPR